MKSSETIIGPKTAAVSFIERRPEYEVDERSVIRPSPVTMPFGIRPGEGWIAWLFFVYFFVLACAQYAIKSVRQAAFIDSWGAEQLPWVYLALALVSFPVLVLYTRIAARYRLHRTIIVFCVLHGLTLAAFYELFALPGRWVPGLFYVWSTVAFGVAVSQLWSYAGQVFNPRQARRLFAFVGAGGLLGGIPGGLIARGVSGWAGTYATLLISGSLFLMVAAVVFLIERQRSSAGEAHTARLEDRFIREARGGLRTVLGSRLLEMIALMVMVTMIVSQMVDLQFNLVIQSVTTDLDHRTAMYGGVFSAMALVGFIFQLIFTRRIHRGLGVGFSMRVLPVTVAVSTVFLIFAIGVVPGVIVGAAWLLKLSEGGLRHSIDQATRELLFLPVRPDLRRRGKAFIDVFVQRFAKGIAAVLLLPVALEFFGMTYVSVMTLVVIVMWLVIAELTRREYVRAFREGLKSGSISEPEPVDLDNVTTMSTLVEAMGSSDAREVIHSIELLASNGQGRLVPPLLLHHDDAEVRRRVIEVLADESREDAAGAIERAIGDVDPVVRGAAIGALATLKKEDAASMMEDRLDDRDPCLRAAAVAFLLDLGRPEARDKASEVLLEMLSDGNGAIRCEAAKALGQVNESRDEGRLIQLFYDPDRQVVREAIRAAGRRQERGNCSPLSIPVLISLMGDRWFKHEAREAIVAHGDQAVDALVLFMNSPDEEIWVRRAIPKTMALTGGAGSVAALMDSLGVSDAFLRAKVIESLSSLRRKNRELQVAPEIVRHQIQEEARRYLGYLVDLVAVSSPHHLRFEGPHAGWGCEGRVPTLLQQFLARRMRQGIDNLFGLLELLYPPDDIRAASRSLSSEQGALVVRALEYLDNSLTGSVRRDVFAVIDDLSIDDKVHRGEQLFSLYVQSAEQTMKRFLALDLERDPDALGLVVATMYGVSIDRVEILLPEVEALVTAGTHPLVRETAEWVAAKMKEGSALQGRRRVVPSASDGGGPTTGEIDMTEMARIEMMAFLQGVDLFSFCDADQMLRLAAISREWRFDEGETIYVRGTPADALYCVVEGRVRLVHGDGREDGVGPRGRFGVGDILSGRMRDGDAVASKPTRVLIIEADDFFDLLSNNIEIVKALFRQLSKTGLNWEGAR
ncbi:MAG: hypothetical protein DRJ61_04400 [Acidobacteria bacterium]|nr:MAG: hypothetical protein DRJ61_04400 [Acidobacteriota bacterium]